MPTRQRTRQSTELHRVSPGATLFGAGLSGMACSGEHPGPPCAHLPSVSHTGYQHPSFDVRYRHATELDVSAWSPRDAVCSVYNHFLGETVINCPLVEKHRRTSRSFVRSLPIRRPEENAEMRFAGPAVEKKGGSIGGRAMRTKRGPIGSV